MYCSNCGNRIKGRYQVCPYCGFHERKKFRYSSIVIVAVSVMIWLLTVLTGGGIWYTLKLGSSDVFYSDSSFEVQTDETPPAKEIDWEDAESYLDLVEHHIRRGEFEKALEYAKSGFRITKDERLKEKADIIESGGNIYDSYGRAIRITGYDTNKNISWWHIFTYNLEEMDYDPVSVTAYDKNGRQTGKVELTYDNKNLRDLDSYYILDYNTGEIGLIKHYYPNKYTEKAEWYQDAEGKELNYYYIIEFDKKGKLKRDEWYNEEDTLYEYGVPEYNEEGLMVKKNWYYREHAGEDFIFSYYTIKEYDDEDRLIKEDSYDSGGELLWYSITEYDNGRMSRYASYDGNGILKYYDTYQNDQDGLGINHYDQDGHLIYSE